MVYIVTGAQMYNGTYFLGCYSNLISAEKCRDREYKDHGYDSITIVAHEVQD